MIEKNRRNENSPNKEVKRKSRENARRRNKTEKKQNISRAKDYGHLVSSKEQIRQKEKECGKKR